MANLFDFLRWRGDISMEYDPFGPVDNLLLAQLAYVDLDGVLPKSFTESRRFDEIYETYWQIHTREEVEKRTTFTSKCPFLMDDVVASVRYRGLRVGGYINEIDAEKTKQICAMYFELPDDSVYIAFRGTDDTITGWKEDFEFSYLTETDGQKMAVEYLNLCLRRFKGRKIRVGGHSKGGNFAAFAAAFCEPELQDGIFEVWNNDGPGMLEETIEKDGYQRIKDRITLIYPESSMVGILLNSPQTPMVVRSSGDGIMQHDGNTWQIEGNRFVTAERLSNAGILNDKSIQSWLTGIGPEERKRFIDTVFSLFESNDIETLSDIRQSKLKALTAMVSTLTNMPREEQENLIRTTGKLIEIYTGNAAESIKARLKELPILPRKEAESKNLPQPEAKEDASAIPETTSEEEV